MGCAAAIVITALLFAAVLVLSIRRARDEKRNPGKYHGAKTV